ncbi:site-specific DNA-methyltransferase [Marnyiella aurantia]|uniref:site-specific DNA-methyltransferase n=1 Tax=Marnyiella aurantia TaxID=2758037 RepID=UPI001FD7F2E0|nr:site-specific DNA-methyltransferase [Marnyiella aurantia]
MDGTSLTPEQEKINALRQVLPEAFSEGKIDWEKLKATLGENINFANERYVLNWAGKSEAFKVMQMPTTKTLVPVKDESINFDETENIFIEGENLEVLKVLQKSYFGKVKMIYIDPPYNTGNDSFIYPDKFSETKADYEKRVGDKDEEGYMIKDGMFKKNSKENGQYHSNWLNMMMPRLYLAKNLLRQDGVIFVSIDDNEVHNLRLLMNEIFGEENWIGSAIWKNATDNNPTQMAVEHEYLHVFAKNKSLTESEWKSTISDIKNLLVDIGKELVEKNNDIESLKSAYTKWFRENKKFLSPLDRYKYIDFDGVYTGSQSVHNPGKEGYRYDVIHPETGKPCNQPLMGYRFPEETMNSLLKEGKILFGDDENKIIELKVYARDFQEKFSSLIELDGRLGSYDLKDLFLDSSRLFNNPKPVRFLMEFFPLLLKKDDIILDFFSGSGSSAHTLYELNKADRGKRKYICVQLPELTDEKSEAYKAGYATIADISKERIRRAGKKIGEEIQVEIKKSEAEITKLQGELPTDETKTEIENLKAKIEQLKNQDLGFKVLKLEDSNFKQWQQIEGKDPGALAEQMKLFIDPVAESATIEKMVYELLLKSGKGLNSTIEKTENFYKINDNELVLLLEKASQEIIDSVIDENPVKVIALDKLFTGNDQLKTNTVLQMKDAGVEFKTI